MSTTALAAVVAKLTGLSLAGKAAAGLAVAVGAVGATGGVAAIVDEAPEVVETDVVDAAEPVDATEVVPDEIDVEEDGTEDGTDPDEKTLPEASDFGQSVAEDAREGGVVGLDIAERARERVALRHSEDESVEPTDEAGQETEVEGAVEVEVDEQATGLDVAAAVAVNGKPAGTPGARP